MGRHPRRQSGYGHHGHLICSRHRRRRPLKSRENLAASFICANWAINLRGVAGGGIPFLLLLRPSLRFQVLNLGRRRRRDGVARGSQCVLRRRLRPRAGSSNGLTVATGGRGRESPTFCSLPHLPLILHLFLPHRREGLYCDWMQQFGRRTVTTVFSVRDANARDAFRGKPVCPPSSISVLLTAGGFALVC